MSIPTKADAPMCKHRGVNQIGEVRAVRAKSGIVSTIKVATQHPTPPQRQNNAMKTFVIPSSMKSRVIESVHSWASVKGNMIGGHLAWPDVSPCVVDLGPNPFYHMVAVVPGCAMPNAEWSHYEEDLPKPRIEICFAWRGYNQQQWDLIRTLSNSSILVTVEAYLDEADDTDRLDIRMGNSVIPDYEKELLDNLAAEYPQFALSIEEQDLNDIYDEIIEQDEIPFVDDKEPVADELPAKRRRQRKVEQRIKTIGELLASDSGMTDLELADQLKCTPEQAKYARRIWEDEHR